MALRKFSAKAQVIIMDNGKGIPEDILVRIGEEGFSFGKANGNGLPKAEASIEMRIFEDQTYKMYYAERRKVYRNGGDSGYYNYVAEFEKRFEGKWFLNDQGHFEFENLGYARADIGSVGHLIIIFFKDIKRPGLHGEYLWFRLREVIPSESEYSEICKFGES